MKKSNILKSLNSLAEKDVYSIMLFTLYCIKDVPEYSALSELVYAVDKESLMNVLSIFGGTTIRIPTVHEMNVVFAGLLTYNLVDLKGVQLEDAIKEAKRPDLTTREIAESYAKIREAMVAYDVEVR